MEELPPSSSYTSWAIASSDVAIIVVRLAKVDAVTLLTPPAESITSSARNSLTTLTDGTASSEFADVIRAPEDRLSTTTCSVTPPSAAFCTACPTAEATLRGSGAGATGVGATRVVGAALVVGAGEVVGTAF